LVDVQIIELQKMLKLVSTRLETQAHSSLKFANFAACMGGQHAESQTGRQAPNQCSSVHSIAKFRFYL
jgi:hypothetical protein